MMLNFEIVQFDFLILILAMDGYFAFALCNNLKNSLADKMAWSFLSLFALSHGLFNTFRLTQRFTGFFPFLETAIPVFAFAFSCFLLGFALNIRSYSGDLSKLRKFWYFLLIAGISGAAFSLRHFAITQALFVALPAIFSIVVAFFRSEVFKVRNICICNKMAVISLLVFFLTVQLVNLGILEYQNNLQLIIVFFSSLLWAASLWFSVRKIALEDASVSVRQYYRLVNFFLPIGLLVIVMAGFFVSAFLTENAFNFEIQSKKNLLQNVNTLIEGRFIQAGILTQQLAQAPVFKEADINNYQACEYTLDLFASTIPDSVVYLMDASGTVLTSSNRNAPDSFVGQNFSFRPYFKDAINGKAGSFLALGKVSNLFGYYHSLPLLSESGEVKLVVVVKINLDRFSRFFPKDVAMAIIDNEGMIVSSNRPSLFWQRLLPFEEIEFRAIESFKDQNRLSYSIYKNQLQPTGASLVWKMKVDESDWNFIIEDSAQFLIWARLLGISITLLGSTMIFGVTAFWSLSLKASSMNEKNSRVYKTLVEGSANIVVLTDIYGNIQTINETGIRELSFDPEIVNRRLPEYWEKESQESVRAAMQTALSGKKAICEAVKIEEKGEKSYWELILNPVIEEDSPPKQLVGIFHNFTKRKMASLELSHEKELTEGILNTAQAIILLMDLKGVILRVNQFFYELTSYQPEDVVGQNWFEKFVPDFDTQRVSSYFRQYLNNVKMPPLVNKIRTAKGKMLEVEWKNRTIKNIDGKVIGVISVGQDITHHLEMESSLRESKTKFAMLNNCFVRFGSSPKENIDILTEAAWLLLGADTAFSKQLVNDKLVLLARASISEELLSDLPEECLLLPEIANSGKEPRMIDDFEKLAATCAYLNPFESAIFCNFFEDEVLSGTIFCCYQEKKEHFSEEEFDLLSIISQAIGIEVGRLKQNQNLEKAIDALAARNRRMSLEMDIARTVHRSFLPSTAPHSEVFDIGFKFKPCFSVGGDYFDFITYPDKGKMGIFFADISGHGVAGALLSSMLKMILFNQTQDCPPAKEVLNRMNGQIEENFPSGYFVSAFYALLDEKSSSIELANAAPEPALVLRKNGRIEIICRGGQPMGLLPKEFTDSETFAGTSIELKSGDVLFLFTDGLTDIKISENERLGIDRLSRWLAEESAKTPQQLCEAIYQRATGMALPESIDDDIMILAVARR
jgi:PAS domain S-box-containing protein